MGHPTLEVPAAASSAHGLLVLSAPPGYRKLALARELGQRWAHAGGARMQVRVWRLEPATTLPHACRALCEVLGGTATAEPQDAGQAVELAHACVAAMDGQAVVVVDASGGELRRGVRLFLSTMLVELAARLRVILLCRTTRMLALERVALSAPVNVLAADGLAWDAEAIARRHGVAPAEAEAWARVTEGWPLLCDARLPAAVADDDAARIDALCALHAGTLENAFVPSVAERDLRLLMSASLFDAVHPGDLEAIGTGASWGRLITLQEEGVPGVRYAAADNAVVLNPVLRAFLRNRLRQRSPALYYSLHRRAAMHFAEAGRFKLALEHARNTSDALLVQQISERNGGWRISFNHGVRALDTFGAGGGDPARFPRASLARCFWLIKMGQLDEAAGVLAQVRDDASLRADVQVLDAIHRHAYRDVPYGEAELETVFGTIRAHKEDDPGLSSSGTTVAAGLLNCCGQYERALVYGRSAVLDSRARYNRYVEFYGHWQSACALHGLGAVVDADDAYRQAAALAEELMGESSNEARLVGLCAAHAAYLQGDDARAELLAGDLAGMYQLNGWLEPYVRALDVAQALSQKRGDALLEEHVLQSFQELSQRRDLPRLQLMVALARIEQDLVIGDHAGALRRAEAALADADGLPLRGLPWHDRVQGPVLLAAARAALAAGDMALLESRLPPLAAVLSRLADGALRVEFELLQALLLAGRGQAEPALARLAVARRLGDRHGIRRPFLRHAGAIAALDSQPAAAPEEGVDDEAAVAAPPATAGRRGAAAAQVPALTERELDVLRCLVDGLSGKEMARRLGIGAGTVKTHRKHLYEKLEVGLRSQAITKARALRLI